MTTVDDFTYHKVPKPIGKAKRNKIPKLTRKNCLGDIDSNGNVIWY